MGKIHQLYLPPQKHGHLEFQLALIENPKYLTMSDGAKIAYMLLANELRNPLWYLLADEGEVVWIEFSNGELCKLLNKSEQTVIEIKKELTAAGLLFQEKVGIDLTQNNNAPNRLYLSLLD